MVSLTILKEQNAERGERFARAFARARNDLLKVSGVGERQMIKLLKELRADINNRLQSFAGARNQPFLAQIIPGIETEIRASIAVFTSRASAEATKRIEEAFGIGSRVTATAFRDAGVAMAFPSVSPEILSSLAASTSQILTDVSTALGDKIIASIRASATGLEPSSLTMRRIGDFIKTSKEFIAGKRRRIKFAFQAEEIVRTETGRVFSNAQQAASEQIATTVPNLRKQWLTVKDARVRDGHRTAERRYSPGGETGPILINQRFQVSDFSRTGRSKFMTIGGRVSPPQGVAGLRVIRTDFTRRGRVTTDRMLYPRDSAARPGNIVNCRCVTLDIVPDIEEAVNQAKGVIQNQ